MKPIYASLLALSAMNALAAGPIGPGIIDATTFLATVQVEWPTVQAFNYQLNANLFTSNRPAPSADIRALQSSSSSHAANGRLIHAASPDSPALFPNFHVGGDTYNKITEQNLADNSAKNVTYRLPYEHLTPYVYGGAGYKTDSKFDTFKPQFSQMGVGTEVRFLDNWSFYLDGRYVFNKDEAQSSTLTRAGLRFSF